jgi:hypothetical protein
LGLVGVVTMPSSDLFAAANIECAQGVEGGRTAARTQVSRPSGGSPPPRALMQLRSLPRS